MSSLEVFMMAGSPPSSAVLALLAEIKVPFQSTELDYFNGDHLTEEFAKRNPQKEVPVIKDGDYELSESVAIMQYLADAYGENFPDLYPKDPKRRGIVNQRLAFNLCNFYANVYAFTFGIVYGGDAEKTKPAVIKSLLVLETILKAQGTKFAAGENFTIADIGLLATAICLDAAGFDLKPYPTVAKWYDECKNRSPVWDTFKTCRDDLHDFFNNPPSKELIEKAVKNREKSFEKSEL
ncbi:glutathione S-transferase 1-like [Neocloeon triangulifer]|uniref:glutathione S-transferase 1-like n=1 Tax=Neocloeon triangulifer TaxID=2078957 RepID=UPI00286F8FBD|nr:glutathione S-transferase 1-like [Neocloeon triangulifer]XP_059486284.1 glutathione S-transferase 1-like [Neocloeon triangulifer]